MLKEKEITGSSGSSYFVVLPKKQNYLNWNSPRIQPQNKRFIHSIKLVSDVQMGKTFHTDHAL